MDQSEIKKSKRIKVLIYITGAICLYAFLAVRFQGLFNFGVKEELNTGYWDNTKYGELFYFNYIKHFREENLPMMGEKFQFSDKQADLLKADILLFGDSFFDICRPYQFPAVISDSLHKSVHFAYNDFPLQYLNKNHYQKNQKPKLLIMGIVERYIPVKFAQKHTSFYQIDQESRLHKKLGEIKDKIFYSRSEELYDALLKRSYLTTDIYTEIASTKFNCFGYISKLTPVYSFKDTVPWIFYFDEVDGKKTSFYYQHSDEEIDQISDNILDLGRQLKKDYNIELLFLPIPAKYTVCHRRINNDAYSNFLPRLHAAFDKKGVPYVKLFDSFMASPDLLYIPTDGHWNSNGLDLGAKLTLEYIRKHINFNDSCLLTTYFDHGPVK